MESRKKNRALIALICIMLGLLLAVAAWNVPLTWRALKATFRSDDPGLLTFEDALETRLYDSFSLKNHFINLNGWLAAQLDQTTCNEIIKLKNGMLTAFTEKKDMSPMAERIVEFRDYLTDLGIEFLYVQPPVKVDLEQRLLPDGIETYGNADAGDLVSSLEASAVHVLDVRDDFAATPERSEKYFYRTDMHWNITAGFECAQLINQQIQRLFPEIEFDFRNADLSQWDVQILKDWMLGLHGWRTGLYYGGVEDVVYYLPKFETDDMLCMMPNEIVRYKGPFDRSIMHDDFSGRQPDYFNESLYGMYIGNNAPLTILRNPNAPNDLRIVFFKDSFILPVAACLSTVYREIDLIDPRFDPSASIAEYVRYYKPDLVIQLAYPQTLVVSSEEYVFGTAEARAKDFDLRRSVINPQDISASGDAPGFTALPLSLQPNQTYLLHFEDVGFTGEAAEIVAVALNDADTGKVIDAFSFDVAYARENEDFQWLFTVPEEAGTSLEMRFCAGIPEKFVDGEAVYRGVQLDAIG